MGAYTLPDLPYGYADLEQFISKQLMELHHDKHHAAYVTGANAALDKLAQARSDKDTLQVAQLSRDLAFNLAGHENHSLFWQNLSPKGGKEPTGNLAYALNASFGSVDDFKKQFNTVALSIQGSGWAVLAYEPISGQMVILQLHDHQICLSFGAVPLLLLDMWEHAFYLDYLNGKDKYVSAFWQVVNWDVVARRLNYAA